jgi:uncharacterized protein (TIGR00255 family)
MTLASMTGFARSEDLLDDWSWAVEARSVNGRNLEVKVRAPTGFDHLERSARELAQSRFQRGQVNVLIQAQRTSTSRQLRVNADVLEQYLTFGEALAADGRASLPTSDGLLALPGVIDIVERDDPGTEAPASLQSAMTQSIARALDGLRQCRDLEGQAIAVVLDRLLERLSVLTEAAEIEAIEQPGLIKARFERRLVELAGDAMSAERIVQEASAMALKADVREELDRLASHTTAARSLIAAGGAVGRRLDFLAQEFMREANTLCAKSSSLALTSLGLELKATIDQLREQVQNVE